MTKKEENLARAMVAESTLLDYSGHKEGQGNGELHDEGESVTTDLVTDLCHLLHLDEKTAGCLDAEKIKRVLMRAFDHFLAETQEADNE